jgi:serine/threonine protein kinase
MALEIGSRLGHYDVTALIGEGGMGQVYQATDTKLNRQVAPRSPKRAPASTLIHGGERGWSVPSGFRQVEVMQAVLPVVLLAGARYASSVMIN